MLIGLISDLHGFLPEGAKEALADCNAIICAGDTESVRVMTELECIAPTVAIHGNCDRFVDFGPTVHDVARPSFEGVRFYVVHRPQDIPDELPRNTRVVVHGHTHIPREEEIDGVLYLNPGSASEPRGGSEPSLMKLVIEECEVLEVQRYILTPYGPQKANEDGRSTNHWDDFDPDEEDDHTHFDFAELGF
jgi:putative phosphoesterase